MPKRIKNSNKMVEVVKNFFYDFGTKFHALFVRGKKENKKNVSYNKKRSATIFYVLMIAIPLIQFLIFYVGVNFNSILLAFKRTTLEVNSLGETTFVTKYVGFDTFKYFIKNELLGVFYDRAIKNSLIYLVVSLFSGIPLSLIFSFYIYKKYPLSSLYRVFLFLPSIICSLILVIFYNYIAERVIPIVIKSITGVKPEGFLSNPKTAFTAIIIFNILISFGPSTLIYYNAMSQIPRSVLEAAEIDGATGFKQFILIVLPGIFSSITSFIIISIAQIAINQLSAFSFYQSGAENYNVQTIGYELFVKVIGENPELNYPTAAAGGILFTLVLAPLTLTIKRLLEKYGPNEG